MVSHPVLAVAENHHRGGLEQPPSTELVQSCQGQDNRRSRSRGRLRVQWPGPPFPAGDRNGVLGAVVQRRLSVDDRICALNQSIQLICLGPSITFACSAECCRSRRKSAWQPFMTSWQAEESPREGRRATDTGTSHFLSFLAAKYSKCETAKFDERERLNGFTIRK